MKVGTDGVLLGAWTSVSQASKIVDVGTGSGLVSLMLAQRNPKVCVLGIDIDLGAFLQAQENFVSSPFSERLSVCHISFEEWIDSDTEKVDVIVSNPPFFVNSLPSPDAARTLARHNIGFTYEDLLSRAKQKLTENGLLSMVLPIDLKQNVLQIAVQYGWSLSRLTTVFPTPDSEAKRILVEFSVSSVVYPIENQIVIEKSRHIYTSDFIALTKDFYLKM